MVLYNTFSMHLQVTFWEEKDHSRSELLKYVPFLSTAFDLFINCKILWFKIFEFEGFLIQDVWD